MYAVQRVNAEDSTRRKWVKNLGRKIIDTSEFTLQIKQAYYTRSYGIKELDIM